MPPDTIPRPAGEAGHESDPNSLLSEIERLREEVRRLSERKPSPGIHQAICQALDRILPAGSKTKTLGVALAALVAGGPHAAAGTLPIPQEWQDWLFHFWTANPGKFTVAAGVLGYLLWASYDARKYREESDR